MANNRLIMLGVDDTGRARIAFTFARHFNGAWRCYDVLPIGERMDEFFDECFEKGYGVALTDEYNDEPLTVVWHYNGNGTKEGRQ